MKIKITAALLGFSVLVLNTGCTSQQVNQVVADIGIYAGAAGPVIQDVITIVTAIEGTTPTAAASTAASDVAKIQSDLSALSSLCAAYNAASTASAKQSVYKQIEALVDTLTTEGDAAVLELAQIKNPNSQAAVTAGIASVDSLLHIIDGLVQSTETPTQVQATAKRRVAKLSQISQYWSDENKVTIGKAFKTSYRAVYSEETRMGF